MVRIRLKKTGRRHQVFFRISAMDMRKSRDGRVLEELGWYDPGAKAVEKQVSLKRERIEFWIGKGAQPSPTVRHLLITHGIPVKKAV